MASGGEAEAVVEKFDSYVSFWEFLFSEFFLCFFLHIQMHLRFVLGWTLH